MGELTSGKKSRKKARKIGLLELTFYVFSRILNLQIHAHIYRSFIRHHKMLGVRIAKRKIEPQKPANPCGARLCSCIFFVNTLQVMIIRTTLSKLVMCSDLSFLLKMYYSKQRQGQFLSLPLLIFFAMMIKMGTL